MIPYVLRSPYRKDVPSSSMAVLGLKTLEPGPLSFLFETSDLNGSIRELTGQEREDALSDAESDAAFNKYVSFLKSDSFTKSRGDAKAYLAEATGKSSVTMVSIPFAQDDTDVTADIKYVKHSGNAESVLGVFKSGDGPYKDIHVHEIVDDAVTHTKTLKWSDGDVVEDPVDSATNIPSRVLRNALPNHADGDDCHVCHDICGIIIGGAGCGLSSLFYCSVLCFPFGNLSCGIICGVLWIAYCLWFSHLACWQICGPPPVGFGYCD